VENSFINIPSSQTYKGVNSVDEWVDSLTEWRAMIDDAHQWII
jgi:hypothetical protein